MRIFIIIITFLTSYKISVGQDSARFRILTYGLPNFEREDAKKVIADKWSIDFYAVAGCVVDQEIIDSVITANKIQEEKLTASYGKGWRDKFEKEVDKEFYIHKQVLKLIDRQDFIKTKNSELEKVGETLYYKIQATDKEKIYSVIVDSWGKWGGKDEFIIYYKLQVDYKRRIVKILSDKARIE